MNAYEALYIVDPELNDEALQAEIEKFRSITEQNGGAEIKIDLWGKKKLAYEINYKTEGAYVLMSFSSAPEFPKELERNFKNDERILRYMVTVKAA